MSKQLTIGLFGFGVVGEGLYKILQQKPSLQATIKKICIKNSAKQRNAPAHLFTTNQNELLDDATINVIVELIDDSEAAFTIISNALQNGKHVVSANKKAIAENLAALLDIQQKSGLSLLYEAAACASIPVIRNLEEYYDNDLLYGFEAIVNGSTNFILTKIFEEKKDFKEALLQAQQLGFAESNPNLDIAGIDAVNKLSLLLNHAYGIVQHPNKILYAGIENITQTDAVLANGRSWDIKLVANAKKLANGNVAAYVLPQFIEQTHHLSFVKNEYNGVVIESSFSDKQFFYGKGAGSFPTASAVLSDISALRYGYKYEYKKRFFHNPAVLTNDYFLKVYVRYANYTQVDKTLFEWMEEWHSNEEACYLFGVIHAEKLLNETWWKQQGISLILHPKPIIETVEIRGLKKISLALAGV